MQLTKILRQALKWALQRQRVSKKKKKKKSAIEGTLQNIIGQRQVHQKFELTFILNISTESSILNISTESSIGKFL